MSEDVKVAVGEMGREVMAAFVRAAAHGFVDDPEYMDVPVGVIQALVGGSKHAVDGAIKHLLDSELISPMVIEDAQGLHESRNWYFLTVSGAKWLIAEGLLPIELASAFFPEGAGWTSQNIEHFLSQGEASSDDLEDWGKEQFSADERFMAAAEVFGETEF